MDQKLRLITICALLALVVQGCGFHLKGRQSISPILAELQVEGYSQLALLIGGRIAELDGQQPIESTANNARFFIESERFDRRVIAVDSSGKAIEYELQYQVKFRVDHADGKPLLTTQTLAMRRSYNSSGEDELGRQDEADILKQDMISSMAERVLRQLEVQLR